MIPDLTGPVIEEPAIPACSCARCRRPDIFNSAEDIALRLLHRDRHETFRAYMAKRNRVPAPTQEIRRSLPLPSVRKIGWRAR